MPANLTPQYQRAENEFRKAQTTEERITCLEEMLRLIPKHKGTDRLQGELRAKLKEQRAELQVEKSSPKKTRSYKIPAQGAGQVLIIGAPNCGKSRLLTEFTKAQSEVANYPYTTHEPIPGMMLWEDVQVQLVDTPPISDTHIESYMTGLVRAADACLLCFDGSSDDAPEQTAEVISQLKDRKTVLAGETGFDEDDFSIVRIRTLLVVTHADDPGCQERMEFLHEMFPEITLPIQHVEFDREDSREELRRQIFDQLGMIRIYTKRPGKPAEYKDPFTIRAGGTVEDLAFRIHGDLVDSLKFAKVWGESAHDGQSVGRDHQLCDRDLVELHT